ncbi:uncharacterized protein LOC130623252 [Hydractinia symbiolongicarpus]|uniref:uncharacterized protein LOC130623252 n=1 Tax=Hydractinia symbiolongicarpus TaxID=13093 RepID=UPI00254FD894|nr:uncharacterized protein LOC130623252 [Hydractinia symbiolongicarpus]
MIKDIQEKDIRIVLLPRLTYAFSQVFFCEVFRQGLLSPKYQFVTETWIRFSEEQYFSPNNTRTARFIQSVCAPFNRFGYWNASRNLFRFTYSTLRIDNILPTANKATKEVWEEIVQYGLQKREEFYYKEPRRSTLAQFLEHPFSDDSPRVFDEVYQVAIGFHNLFEKYKTEDILVSSKYEKDRAKRIQDAINNAEFEGITLSKCTYHPENLFHFEMHFFRVIDSWSYCSTKSEIFIVLVSFPNPCYSYAKLAIHTLSQCRNQNNNYRSIWNSQTDTIRLCPSSQSQYLVGKITSVHISSLYTSLNKNQGCHVCQKCLELD